jgi:hypothetical protein
MEKELELPKETSKNLIVRYFTQMPIFFPLIGLFMLGLALSECWSYATDHDYGAIYWFRPVLFFIYFLIWVPICYAKKWAGFTFLILSILGMSFDMFGPDIMLKHAIGDVLIKPIPINILFSFLLLFYFRRMK